MISKTNKDGQHNHQRNRRLLLAAGISLFLLIVSGGVLSASGTGSACPDWPTCLGSWSLPEAPGAQFAYAHRILTALTALFLVPSFLAAWKDRRELPLMSKMVFLSVGFFTVQIGLGAWVALQPGAQLQEWLGAAHLGLSLFSLAGIAAATVISFHPQGSTQALIFRSPFGRLSLAMIGLLLVLFTSGVILNASQAGDACTGWPLCSLGAGSWSAGTSRPSRPRFSSRAAWRTSPRAARVSPTS